MFGYIIQGVSMNKNSIVYTWLFESIETCHKSSALTALNMYDSSTMVLLGVYALFISRNWQGLVLTMYALTFVAFIVIYLVLPESPKYLLIHGRINEAHESLKAIAKLNGVEYTIPPDAVFIEQALAGHLPVDHKEDINNISQSLLNALFKQASVKSNMSGIDSGKFNDSKIIDAIAKIAQSVERINDSYDHIHESVKTTMKEEVYIKRVLCLMWVM